MLGVCDTFPHRKLPVMRVKQDRFNCCVAGSQMAFNLDEAPLEPFLRRAGPVPDVEPAAIPGLYRRPPG